MLVDIFSVFDDKNLVFFSEYLLSWTMTSTAILLLNAVYWTAPNNWSGVLNIPKNMITAQVQRSTGGGKLGGFTNITAALFLFIIFSNLLGLIPYVFSTTSHLVVTMPLALPLWLSLILSSIALNPAATAASLLPGGAPILLNPFLILVETVSIMARPITLSVRLAANMSAGHIILGLMSTYLAAGLFTYPLLITTFLVLLEMFYFTFELGICMIQAYVFVLLISLYSDDHAFKPSHYIS
uniref:ATP synthase subunit a n=1 Tax=Granata lyrata TaxID=479586 RepID=A0A0S1F5M4_GRALY|nr:ATP synthase F0 subunit 6 [Granata lyrata]ALK03366.1 ATP synthase F0 subunit 6 [Granata lyrata]